MEDLNKICGNLWDLFETTGLSDEVTDIYPAEWIGPSTTVYEHCEQILAIHSSNVSIPKVKKAVDSTYPGSTVPVGEHRYRVLYHVPTSFSTYLGALRYESRTISHLPGPVRSLTNHLLNERKHGNIVMVCSLNCRYTERKPVNVGKDHLIIVAVFKGLKPIEDDIFPTEFIHDGVTFPVDIIDGGERFEFSMDQTPFRFSCLPYNPLRLGCSLGPKGQVNDTGTLGCFVRKLDDTTGGVYALTAGQVTLNECERKIFERDGSYSNSCSKPDSSRVMVVQPSEQDDSRSYVMGFRKETIIGNIRPRNKPEYEVGIDAGLVEITRRFHRAEFIPWISGAPVNAEETFDLIYPETEPVFHPQDSFIKVGRTSGQTGGILFSTDASVLISHPKNPRSKLTVFKNQMIFYGDFGPFTYPGDSGSVIWRTVPEKDQREAVGLCWSTNGKFTAGTSLGVVMDYFNVEMVIKKVD